MTSFTSFVAVDSEVVNKNGGSTSVKQPLPLPEGVSNHAVGSVAKLVAPTGNHYGYGGGYAARKSGELSLGGRGSGSPAAVAPQAIAADKSAPEKEEQKSKDDRDASGPAPVQSAEPKWMTMLRKLVSEGQSCGPSPKEMVLRVSVDKLGQIKAISLLRGDKARWDCVLAKLKPLIGLPLEVAAAHADITVVVK